MAMQWQKAFVLCCSPSVPSSSVDDFTAVDIMVLSGTVFFAGRLPSRLVVLLPLNCTDQTVVCVCVGGVGGVAETLEWLVTTFRESKLLVSRGPYVPAAVMTRWGIREHAGTLPDAWEHPRDQLNLGQIENGCHRKYIYCSVWARSVLLYNHGETSDKNNAEASERSRDGRNASEIPRHGPSHSWRPRAGKQLLSGILSCTGKFWMKAT